MSFNPPDLTHNWVQADKWTSEYCCTFCGSTAPWQRARYDRLMEYCYVRGDNYGKEQRAAGYTDGLNASRNKA